MHTLLHALPYETYCSPRSGSDMDIKRRLWSHPERLRSARFGQNVSNRPGFLSQYRWNIISIYPSQRKKAHQAVLILTFRVVPTYSSCIYLYRFWGDLLGCNLFRFSQNLFWAKAWNSSKVKSLRKISRKCRCIYIRRF